MVDQRRIWLDSAVFEIPLSKLSEEGPAAEGEGGI
jgi:hypothetical protein